MSESATKTRPALTATQRQILDVIRAYQEARGCSPALREIGAAVGMSSTSSVAHHLRTLASLGYLLRQPMKPRTIELIDADTGKVTAGMVLAVSPVDEERAERIAAYATARIGGQRWRDACRAASISDTCGRRYERIIGVLCGRFGLPEPPPQHKWTEPDYLSAAYSGAHERHHVRNAIRNPACHLCQDSTVLTGVAPSEAERS